MFNLPEPPLDLYYDKSAYDAIAALDRSVRQQVVKTLRRYAATGTPRPKALTGELKGLWKMRIGDYRAVFLYRDQIETIPTEYQDLIGNSQKFAYLLAFGHRSEVYKNLKK
jgi:mRNA-degrading endonuclease RelE of RelBE toxin-antitoxin system